MKRQYQEKRWIWCHRGLPYGCLGSTLERSIRRIIPTPLSPEDADQILIGCAEQIESVAEMLADLDGRFTEIVDTVDWTSFSPEQRAQLKHWHVGSRQAKHYLRAPNGI